MKGALGYKCICGNQPSLAFCAVEAAAFAWLMEIASGGFAACLFFFVRGKARPTRESKTLLLEEGLVARLHAMTRAVLVWRLAFWWTFPPLAAVPLLCVCVRQLRGLFCRTVL